MEALEAALSNAVNAVLTADEAAVADRDVASQVALQVLRDKTGDEVEVSSLQRRLAALQHVLETTKQLLEARISVGAATSRAGYLRSLDELIGPASTTAKWDDDDAFIELRAFTVALRPQKWAEFGYQAGWSQAEAVDWLRRTPEGIPTAALFQETYRQGSVDTLIKRGWAPETARCYGLLSAMGAALGAMLRDRNKNAAVCVHALYNVMCERMHLTAKLSTSHHAPMLYRHQNGGQSLTEVDEAWARLEKPDNTGFCGICASGITVADCDPANFSAQGYMCRFQSKELGVVYTLMDSDIIGFESRPEDEHGAHSAILTYTDATGAFPPNTLFRLRHILPAGSWEAPGGVYPQRRLLVVTATYLIPSEIGKDAAATGAGGGEMKHCSAPTMLSYGDRAAYANGIDALIAKPLLTMELEFGREHSWTDWKGARYTLQGEWAYVTGAARAAEGCTPGTRDADNDGRTAEQFLQMANDLIRKRRAEGVSVLPESHAFLTMEEMLAVRLYSGPAYQVLNGFLRMISSLQGPLRSAFAQHPEHTFTATVRHLCFAIRKLAAITPPREAESKLYRGVRGQLPPSFWEGRDSMGITCAVDMAFMSTSKNQHTPVAYMSPGENVLWRMHPSSGSDGGFHRGADISLFSQFAGEDEILFPPMTMLKVLGTGGTGSADAVADGGSWSPRADGQERVVAPPQPVRQGDKQYVVVDVLPCFL